MSANGGTVTFDNIDTVQLGTADNPLKVDQIVHENWGGGDITFSNIGILNAYSATTGFMVQPQSGTLHLTNIDTVNIVGQGMYGISLTANTTTNQTTDLLDVDNVTNFFVQGKSAGIYVSDNAAGFAGTDSITATIHAENVTIAGNVFGIYSNRTQQNSQATDLTIIGDKAINIESNFYGVTSAVTSNSGQNGIKLEAPKVSITVASEEWGQALQIDKQSTVTVKAAEIAINSPKDAFELKDTSSNLILESNEAGTIGTTTISGNVIAKDGSTIKITDQKINQTQGTFQVGSLIADNSTLIFSTDKKNVLIFV